jgi:hypothetical protein
MSRRRPTPASDLDQSDAARSLRGCLRLVVLALGALVLAACATAIRIPPDRPLTPPSGPLATLAEPGAVPVSIDSGEHPGAFGCTVAFEIYRPSSTRTETMVFLAHGFMRDMASMRGWAAHWSSHGVPVTVMSLCNSSWFAGHHDRNAVDMKALAHLLHEGPALYAGFSAGGLAAYLAAVSDARTTAYLGLDPVDSSGLAQGATATLTYPSLLLVAEPSACNAENNMLESLSGVQGYSALRLRNTTHCHYENPYDPLCESVCGFVEPAEAQQTLLRVVRALASAWVLAQTLDDEGLSPISGMSGAEGGPWAEHIEVLR